MVYRIMGRAGSGKTEYMISCLKERQSMGMDCLFLVPEQQSMDAEELLESRGCADLGTEVLNFERLPNRVFREIGGIAADTVDSAGRCALTAAAADALAGELTAFKSPGRGTIAELCETIGALKKLSVSAKSFEAVCEEAAEGADDGFTAKLKETALIYKKYEELLGDARDDDDPLTLLAKSPEAASFFKGKAVFIDGIYTFTPQQYEVLRLIADSADFLYISFTVDGDDIFEGSARCAERVKQCAHGRTTDVVLPESRRAVTDELIYGEKRLWSGGEPYDKEVKNIRLACADSRYEESLYAAKTVYELRAEGCRFDEIAVCSRRPESYAGTLDAVFASVGIPFYFAVKDSAATKPLSAAVLSLLEMAEKNFPLFAVKKYLKSGFSVLDAEQTDSLLRYAESWKIRGRAWVNENDWLMNPDGYREGFTESAEKRLKRINESRFLLASSLSGVTEALRSPGLTVGEGVKLLYAHLEECGAKEKLSEMARRLEDAGDSDAAAKTAALWGLIVDVFDRLYTLSGSLTTSCGRLRSIIEAMLESASLGAIPSYTDAVSIGDARLMRASGVKAMIILGVNEGVFPSLPEKSGVFTAKESALLEKHGVELLPSVEKAVEEERFFFYNCASAPTERLYLSYISGDGGKPSPLFTAVQALFPKAAFSHFGEDERDYLFCRKAALDRLPYIKSPALKRALRAELEKDGGVKEAITGFPPVSDTAAVIRESSLSMLTLSYSKIDCYNNCGMHYLLNYILRLKDDRRLGFTIVDSGKYMHRVLEEYVRERIKTGTYVPADEAETRLEIDAITDAYLRLIMPEKPTKRLYKLIDRLKNAALFTCLDINDEFTGSGFVPIGCEVSMCAGGSFLPPVYTTDKGRRVKTVGVIDRVDSAIIDGRRYIRVADYKSSSHSFDPKKVENGEKIQMLSYLFSYCAQSKEEALPAGVLYRSFALPKGDEGFKLTGIVLDDEKVINAMGGKVGRLRSAKKADEETVNRLEKLVTDHIKQTADRICDGVMNAETFKRNPKDKDCSFCPYGEVCRSKKEKKKNF